METSTFPWEHPGVAYDLTATHVSHEPRLIPWLKSSAFRPTQ